MGTGVAGDVELVDAARHRDHLGAKCGADLDCGQPDPARRAEHHQRLAGLRPRAVGQRQMRRAIGDHEARGPVSDMAGASLPPARPGRWRIRQTRHGR